MIDPLTNPIKDYAWGSRTAIAALTGRPTPSPGPEAEMWLGAHPSGPSMLRRGETERTLDEVVAADPAGELGEATLTRFGPRLPYLMKLIAVAAPLSLQVHPTAEQAREGHARGKYVDPCPKPELVCALTPFTALAGFRPPREAAELVAALGVAELEPVIGRLRDGQTSQALRALLEWPRERRRELVSAIAAKGDDLVVRLAELYPEDPAVLAPLLMRRHELRPGQALFLGAGVLHAYVDGFGVEIMGASDNVLRAGLTPKPIDVEELLRVVDPAGQPLEVEPEGHLYRTPAPEFALGRAHNPRLRLTGGLPRILLCTEGEVLANRRRLAAGESAFVAARVGDVELHGRGTVFWAQPNLA
ncbi:mannose-6-phosphate isomerase, class I [Thermoactinospora rubra]|uniref:mannose-6-phosphate isomerase, class I n=1 Tax=Thermoactinospora rubra TaxID=1088767 RepID=UPI001F0B0A1D|nr:mannose-6-phosphate isomerase, class I [Thermoactinospora rubra]